MATQVQRRRGTTAQHAAFSGQLAELTVDTDKLTVVVQDGATLGGHPLAKFSDLTATNTSIVDAGANFVSTNVEGALAELAAVPTGLAYFTEARSVVAPNNIIPAHSVIASGAEVDIDAVFAPKGAGAITTAIPDSLAAGGNKRGANAVDLQMLRSAAADVASGDYSTLIGGFWNEASGNYSVSIGGAGNVTSSSYGITVGGDTNNNTATYGGMFGAFQSTLSGLYGAIVGGAGASITGAYSASVGGRYGSDRGLENKLVFGGGQLAVNELAQVGTQILRVSTTDAIPKIMYATGVGLLDALNHAVLPDGCVYAIKATVVAREPATNDCKVWELKGVVKRGVGVATTALVGSVTSTVIAADAGAAAWTATLAADAVTYGSAQVTVTGEAAHTIYWNCSFETVELG